MKDLSHLNLNDIIQYNKNDDNTDNERDLSDIYNYLFYYSKNNKEKGKYSDNFLEKLKKHNKNLRLCKKEFKLKLKNYNIGKDNKLRKYVSIKDKITN